MATRDDILTHVDLAGAAIADLRQLLADLPADLPGDWGWELAGGGASRLFVRVDDAAAYLTWLRALLPAGWRRDRVVPMRPPHGEQLVARMFRREGQLLTVITPVPLEPPLDGVWAEAIEDLDMTGIAGPD